MPSELISLLTLLAIIVIATATNINIGVIAFVAVWAVGSFVWDLSMAAILEAFPTSTVLLLFGVGMYSGLFKETGTGELIVDKIVSLTRGRLWLIPWMLFIVALLLTSVSMGIIFMVPICSALIKRCKITPMLVAAMTLCGAQTGPFSPLSHYGIISENIVARAGLSIDPFRLFTLVIVFNVFVAFLSFTFFGGFSLLKHETVSGFEKSPQKLELRQTFCLLSLPLLAILILCGVDMSAALIAICVLLSFTLKISKRPAVLAAVPWSVVMLVAGLMTYVGLLETTGTIDWMGTALTESFSGVAVGFFLCLATAVISYFASSLGSLGAMLPLATPMMLSGQVSTVGACAAIGVCSTIVDISPFSAYGALMLTMVDEDDHQQYSKFRLSMLVYGGILVFVGPLLAWLLFWVLGVGA